MGEAPVFLQEFRMICRGMDDGNEVEARDSMGGASRDNPQKPSEFGRRCAAAFAIGLFTFSLTFTMERFGFLQGIEALSVDARFRLASDASRADPKIVIINIGQEDIELAAREMKLRWPWPRGVHGELLDRLAEVSPRAVFFDQFFTEQSDESAADDRTFAQAIENFGSAYLPAAFHKNSSELGRNSEGQKEKFAIDVTDDASLALPRAKGATFPIPPLLDALEKTSHGVVDVSFHADRDKVGRHYPLLTRHGTHLYPSTALKIALDLQPPNSEIIIQDGTFWLGQRTLATRSVSVQNQKLDLFPLRYHGGHRTYAHHSYIEVMNPDEYPNARLREVFGDAIVLVGSDAPGLFDMRPGPFREMSGVEFHAAALDNLLNGTALRPMPRSALLFLLLVAAFGTALCVMTLSGLRATISIASLAAAYLATSFIAFRHFDLRIELVAPLFATAVSYSGTAMWRSMTEGRRRREAKYALEHFLPPAVVNGVLGDLNRLRLGGQKEEISIFFSDLAGFTNLSEHMAPEALVDLINAYLTAMCQVLHEEEATIDKYVGDAIVAFWGAPTSQPDHALRACRAALANQSALREFRMRLEGRELPTLSARIGINTGPAVVGFMGFRSSGGGGGRFNYTMMGDAVNLGARLEGVNKEFGTAILISESTAKQAENGIETRELALLRVKGRQEPTRIFELLSLKGDLDEGRTELRDRFQAGLSFYRNRHFKEALERFEACLDLDSEDGASQWYQRQCREFLTTPPPAEWDAVHSAKKL